MGTSGGAGSRLLPCFAIVKRDHPDIFRTLKADLEEPEVVEVIWDRRTGERRRHRAPQAVTAERRRGERRGPPPEMWGTFGFLVAPQVPPVTSA